MSYVTYEVSIDEPRRIGPVEIITKRLYPDSRLDFNPRQGLLTVAGFRALIGELSPVISFPTFFP